MVNNLKDESEAYRKMTLETIEKVIASLGAADIGERLEERLIDGVLHSFQEQRLWNCCQRTWHSMQTLFAPNCQHHPLAA